MAQRILNETQFSFVYLKSRDSLTCRVNGLMLERSLQVRKGGG